MKSLRRLVIAAAVAAGILLLLHPQYEKYMDHYYARTCSKARHYTMDMYSDELRDRKAGTDRPSEADMRLFLQNFVKNTYDQEVTEELFERGLPESGIWNVNFPGTDQVEEARGVLFERKPARLEYHYDHYDMKELEDGSIRLDPQYHRLESAPEGTDIEAVLNGYISVGIVDTMV